MSEDIQYKREQCGAAATSCPGGIELIHMQFAPTLDRSTVEMRIKGRIDGGVLEVWLSGALYHVCIDTELSWLKMFSPHGFLIDVRLRMRPHSGETARTCALTNNPVIIEFWERKPKEPESSPMNATPETDKELRADRPEGLWVYPDFARCMERERDTWRIRAEAAEQVLDEKHAEIASLRKSLERIRPVAAIT